MGGTNERPRPAGFLHPGGNGRAALYGVTKLHLLLRGTRTASDSAGPLGALEDPHAFCVTASLPALHHRRPIAMDLTLAVEGDVGMEHK